MFGHATYLLFELGWAVPVICLQWLVGWRILWKRRRTLLLVALFATVYLSCTDAVAISQGIWSLHAPRIVGLRLGNVPIEELIFFLLTDLMVIQSVLLLYRPPPGLWTRLPSSR